MYLCKKGELGEGYSSAVEISRYFPGENRFVVVEKIEAKPYIVDEGEYHVFMPNGRCLLMVQVDKDCKSTFMKIVTNRLTD